MFSTLRIRLAAGRFSLLVFLLLVGLALPVTSASAEKTHLYTGVSFGPDGVGGSASFKLVTGVAVDSANGDVYVYDGEASKIYKFNASGAPLDFSALGTNVIEGVEGSSEPFLAINEIALAPAGSPGGTAGDIYLANGGNGVQVYGKDGSRLGEINQSAKTCGVATDPGGNLFAGTYPTTVKKYTPTTNPPTATDQVGQGTGTFGLCNVAADGLGNVYTAYFGGGIYKLEGLGDSTLSQVDPVAGTMVIAPVSNDLYALQGTQVSQYDSGGTKIDSFVTGELPVPESQGLAINHNEDKIYVGNHEKVKVFGPLVILADPTAEPATEISRTGATLHGTISAAGGPAATCQFEYVSNAQFKVEGFANPSTAACEPAGPFNGSGQEAINAKATGLAVDTEYLFRLTASNENGTKRTGVEFFTTAQAVTLTAAPATNVTGSSARLNATITPEGAEIEECVFEVQPALVVASVPCAESASEIGTGDQPVAVHADISGLESGTRYEYRLLAKNSSGSSASSLRSFATTGPKAGRTNAVEITETSAVLTGQIAPAGEETSYVFEYVSDAEFSSGGYSGAQVVPLGGSLISGDDINSIRVEVRQEVTGLQPFTAYHLRLVATNPGGTSVGADKVVRTFGPSPEGLPDGRAYEQVTPYTALGKNANSLLGVEYVSAASPDGNAATYYAVTGAGESEGAGQYPIYVARREAGGWVSDGINPPASTGTNLRQLDYTRSLSGSYSVASTSGEPATLYRREFGGQLFQLASGITGNTNNIYVSAESEDEDLVLFESPGLLTDNAVAGNRNAYLWDKRTGSLGLVGVLPDGSAAPSGSFAGPWNREGGRQFYSATALSLDGTRAFFTAVDTRQIYLRENPATDSATTVPVSASQKTNGPGGGGDPEGPLAASFLEATPSGSYAFFMSAEDLTNDANTGPGEGEDLYRYDVASDKLVDLTAGNTDPEGARVLGTAGVSKDGSYVYFAAKGQLTAGAPSDNEPKLYVWHEGEIKLVSTLETGVGDDETIWIASRERGGVRPQRAARVTPDGQAIVFASQLVRPGYDNRDKEETPVREIYRYEFESSNLQCLSCNPTGASAEAGASLQDLPSPFIHPSAIRAKATRNMSSDGRRVVFQTDESLLGRDQNGVADVYEWEEKGKAGCTSEEHSGGCLFLISTGTSPEPAYLSDTSESGDDVFFYTTQSLVGQDKDELSDLYDARVGGGLAAQNPPPPNPCQGEACLGAGTVAPAPATPGSSTFAGPGNEKPAKHKKKHKKRHRKQAKHTKRSHGARGGK